MRSKADTMSLCLEHFTQVLARTAGEPDWLRQHREKAMERFLALGVPSVKEEEYKYTNLSPLADTRLLFSNQPGSTTLLSKSRTSSSDSNVSFGGATGSCYLHSIYPPYTSSSDIVLKLDDEKDPDDHPANLSREASVPDLQQESDTELTVPAGLHVTSLCNVLQDNPDELKDHLAAYADFQSHALCALNTAFFEDGVLIKIAPGTVLEAPIHVVFGGGAKRRFPRVLILAGSNSQVRIIESYTGSGVYWRNAVTEIHAAENARVDHYRVQTESEDAYHTSLVQAVQERDSYVANFSLSFGAVLARNDIRTKLLGTGCECSLDGLYAVQGRQHVDHHTGIDHTMPHCHSHQLYKGVLDDRSRGVFNGKIFVRKDAQKTDAVQSNKNLLLSDFSEINTKPQLEIDANDVKCTHGATIGQLDNEAAFYLRSRGIDANRAQSILTYAFAADALERIKDEPLKKHFEELLLEKFS